MLAVGLGTTRRRFMWKLQIYQQQYVHLDDLQWKLTIFFCLQSMSQYVFSKKPLILGNSRLQSTMDTKNSSYFVLRLNKYVLTCDGNSFQMVLRTLSYAIAAWYAMHDVRCSLFKTQCTVNGTRSMIAHDTPSMIAHDTPFAFKTARCMVFKRKWCALTGIIGQCYSHLRKNATQPEKYANWSKQQSL